MISLKQPDGFITAHVDMMGSSVAIGDFVWVFTSTRGSFTKNLKLITGETPAMWRIHAEFSWRKALALPHNSLLHDDKWDTPQILSLKLKLKVEEEEKDNE